MTPKLSIIIPCYNTESTLGETLTSVKTQVFENWEAIIVNDSSPDGLERIALDWVDKDSRFKYYKKENGGLGDARNFGISKSNGVYILPLDSDNKIRPDFTKKAINILDQEPSVGVVHGNAMFFGEKEEEWIINQYNFEQMLIKNYIDACAVYRKSLWKNVNGYDTKMPYQGNEDWDLWLAFGSIKTTFKHLNEITFDYRVSKNSMINSFNSEMFAANKSYIRKKYCDYYFFYFNKNFKELAEFNESPFRSTLYFFKKWIKSLIVNSGK
ncbi:glycosyltransferase family 2 protein [Planktosalinus lacus]|uniref:Glycosyl transferase n=1 Tax=Planktosalinus lacus TaxID=1526573 RepID=A0A8J2V8X2_9FLAO|nr:glycosyltransferase family 2 protein [Planktosalinus lacus]GGD84924.1 glycosyl transferase [Planktosalinus lacus]